MKRSLLWPLLTTAFVLTLLISLLVTPATPSGLAQDSFTATPATDGVSEDEYTYDDPARIENGDAEWTLNETQFISNYPDGFTFMGNASSTGGALVSVSVFYSSVGKRDYEVRQRGEVNPETGTLRVVVEGRDADGIPPWVPINYQWRITDESGTVYFSDWIIGAEYSDNTRQWTRLETNDALVFIQPGLPADIADVMFQKLDETHDQYMTVFGAPLSYSPRIILFADLPTFREWRSPDEYDDNNTITVGQTYGPRGTIVQFLFNNQTAEELANTVVHEVTHLYQFDKFEFRGIGWWIEGEATYFEFDQSYDYERRVMALAETNDIPAMFREPYLPPDATGADGRGRLGYDLGYTFYDYIVRTYGFEAIRELGDRLAEPDNVSFFDEDDLFIESLEAVTGKPIDELERDWRVWLGASPELPTVFPTPTIAFNILATVTPFGQ